MTIHGDGPKRTVVAQDATCVAVPCLALESEGIARLVRRCADDEDAIVAAVIKYPHCVLLLEQTALTRALVERLEMTGPTFPKIIVRADEVNPSELEDLISLDCIGVISSEISPQNVRRMLTAVEHGEMWLERKWSSYLIRQLLNKQKVPRLSRREHDVLNLLRWGLKNREIADALAISEETLRWHLRHLYAKTRRRSREELVLYAEAVSGGENSRQMQVPQ